MEELDVWNWKKKYPYWKQKGEAVTDGCHWTLKLRDRKGREKENSIYQMQGEEVAVDFPSSSYQTTFAGSFESLLSIAPSQFVFL